MTVAVDELIMGIDIALGAPTLTDCRSFDSDQSGTVTVDELVHAVDNALHGCR